MADTLGTLGRLRRLEEDQAKRALGEAVRLENHARQGAADAHAARRHEASVAGADGGLTGAYAAWLPASSTAIEAAEGACRLQIAAVAAAGQQLIGCKAALEAVKVLQADRDRIWRRAQVRLAQLRLDELGHRLG